MSEIVVGIDPGVGGAVVPLEVSTGKALGCIDTPTVEVPGPKRRVPSKVEGEKAKLVPTLRQAYNKPGMKLVLRQLMAQHRIVLVVIEEVAPMPRFGRKSASGEPSADEARGSNPFTDFGLGRSLGLWEGICEGLDLRVETIPPATWKPKLVQRPAFAPDVKPSKRRALIKEAARLRALELFPDLVVQLMRKSDHGRAEAALLAEFGRRYLSFGAVQPSLQAVPF